MKNCQIQIKEEEKEIDYDRWLLLFDNSPLLDHYGDGADCKSAAFLGQLGSIPR